MAIVRIRRMKKNDISSAIEIVELNYSIEYGKLAAGEIQDMFRRSSVRPTYYVGEENGDVVGFAGYCQSLIDYSIFQLFWVNVHPNRQNIGIGKSLVLKIISEVQKKQKNAVIIITVDKTAGNDKYYNKNFGFREIQRFDNGKSAMMSFVLDN